jgi:hypothetical protein
MLVTCRSLAAKSFALMLHTQFFCKQDAGISGLNSKTHMKILLKWMTGRRIVKLSCTHVGNAKKFLYSPYTEGSEAPKPKEEAGSPAAAAPQEEASAAAAPGGGKWKATRGEPKKQAAALR